MNGLLKVIFIFLIISVLSCPFSEAQSDEDKLKETYLKESYLKAITLYKSREYATALVIFNEIRDIAPRWQEKQIGRYIATCEKRIEALKQEALTKPQDSWWKLLATEELDQPEHGSVESLFTEYKNLQNELENKEARLKYLNDQLKQLQTDSAAFRIQQLVRENSLLNSKLNSSQENFEKLQKYADELKQENSRIAGLQQQAISLDSQIQEKDSTIKSLNTQLSSLKGSIIDKDSDYLSVKKTVQSKTDEFNASLKEKDAQINSLGEQINNLSQMLEEAKQTQEKNLLLSQQVDSLENQLTASDLDLQKKDDLISKTTFEKEKLMEELKEKEDLIRQANQRLMEVNKEVNKFKLEIDEIKRNFQQKDKSAKIKVDSISRLPQQDKSIAQLQEKLNFTLEKYKILEKDLRIAKQNYQVLKRKLADKERLIAQLKQRHKARGVTTRGKEGYSPQQEAQIQELTAQISRKNQLLAEKDKEILSLQETIQNTYGLLEDISE